jgi:hypothetical protein
MAEAAAEPAKGGKKKGKYTWWIVGGGAFAILIIYFLFKNSSSSATNSAATNAAATAASDTDPATGYPYGSPADLAALGESSGSSEYGNNASTTPQGTVNNYYSSNTWPSSGVTTTSTATTTNPPGSVGGSGPPGTGMTPVPVSSRYVANSSTPQSLLAASSPHVVTPADSGVAGVSAKYGTSVGAIYDANKSTIGSSVASIHPGQRLNIPG